jgi:hypothetical protein
VANLVAKNANEAMAAPMVGSGGVCSQAVGLYWCAWQQSGFSRREFVFTFNLLYKEILCILFAFNAI